MRVCSENFCFKHVRGVLLKEVKLAYKKHTERLASVRGGVGSYETVKAEVAEHGRTGQVPKWCRAKQVLPPKLRLLQDAANTLEVTSPDGNRQSLDKELLREFPWLERLWQGHRLSDSSTGADLLAAASAEWEKLQLYSKYYLAEKQQQQTRAAFAPESLQADLDAHLDKLLAAVGELTGETMEQLRPKYSREREELKAFAHLVQKTLATKAAAEKMRETQQTAKAQAKQQAAKDKVEAMDLNQVVAASVTQSLLQVLPTCGVQVPKKVQASLAAAATKPVAESNVREAVLQGLLAQDQAGKPGKGKGKGKGKSKGRGRGGGASQQQQPKPPKGKGAKGKSKGKQKASKGKTKGKGKPKGKGKSKQPPAGGQKGKGKGIAPGPTGRGKGRQGN